MVSPLLIHYECRVSLHRRSALQAHKHRKSQPNQSTNSAHGDVDCGGIAVEWAMRQGIEPGLGEIDNAGETYNRAVDAAKSGETKYFCRVVTALKYEQNFKTTSKRQSRQGAKTYEMAE